MSEEYAGPYDRDTCHFKFKGCLKKPAGYSRRQNGSTTGEYFDACENCARTPYPQIQEENSSEPATREPVVSV